MANTKSKSIVLKHVAREVDKSPHRVRVLLRDKYGIRRSWRWDEDDPELEEVRQYLRT